MSNGYSVVIVRAEHVAPARERVSAANNIGVIAEADLLRFHDDIVARHPEIVLMHSALAETSRGATLISALKTSMPDSRTAIRVFIEDDDKAPLLLAETALTPNDALLETSRPLDRAGTRQAARYPMARRAIAINGDAGQLIDLSVSGAQVQSATRLRPLKVARLVLPDGAADIRMQGTVAWAIAVPAAGGIQYRAGIEFVNPDRKQLAAFCAKNGGVPDPTLGKSEK
jgi:hypothetical protein